MQRLADGDLYGRASAPDKIWSELRDCVTAFAAGHKAKGDPPELTIALLKNMAADTLRAVTLRRSVVERTVTWVVGAYFPPQK
jgi:hypothetical protein